MLHTSIQYMMTSSKGNIFRVTGHLCGEFTGPQWRGALVFSLICVWINGWVNDREAGDLRRYRAHYDVIVMVLQFFFIKCRIRLKYYWLDGCHSHNPHEWVIKFNDLPRLADTEVHAVHISHALCNISKPRVNLNWSYSQFGSKSVISSPVWLWNLMEDLKKQYDTFSTLHQALCIISYVSVNYNWSYSPETPKVKIDVFLSRVTLKFDRWHWKR